MDSARASVPDMSMWRPALNWALLCPMLCFALHGIVRVGPSDLNGGALAAYQPSLLEVIGAPASIVVLALVSAKYRVAILRVGAAQYLFVLLTALSVLSTAWSQFSNVSLRAGIYQAMDLWFACYLVVRFKPQRQIALFQMLGWCILLASLFAALALPAYGRDRALGKSAGAWIGIFDHKNYAAIVVAFLLSSAFYLKPPTALSKGGRIVFIFLALIFIVMTQSRTGWFVAVSLFCYVGGMKCLAAFRDRDRFALLVTGVVVLVASAFLLSENYSTMMEFVGKDATLTGRADVWVAAFHSVMQRPFLGYGFQAFWHGLDGESANVVLAVGFVPTHAHNGFIQIWLDLGVVGLALVVLSMMQAARNAYTCLRRDWTGSAEWYLCIVVLTVVSNVSEVSLMVPNYIVWVMYVLACVGLNVEACRLRHLEYA